MPSPSFGEGFFIACSFEIKISMSPFLFFQLTLGTSRILIPAQKLDAQEAHFDHLSLDNN
jgi:hypothetical protein